MDITLRRLARRIKADPKVVKGAAIGARVKLHITPNGIWMNEADARIVATAIEDYRAAAFVAA